MIDLSPEIKHFAREHDREIRERCLADFREDLDGLTAEQLHTKYAVGAKEHGEMTQFKFLLTIWQELRRDEVKDFYWYTAMQMFKERFFSRREPAED